MPFIIVFKMSELCELKDTALAKVGGIGPGHVVDAADNPDENSEHSSRGSDGSVDSHGNKKPRAMLRRGGIFPGAKWRRLRNTLRAAQEMQAPRRKPGLQREDSFLKKFSTRRNSRNNENSDNEEDQQHFPMHWRSLHHGHTFVVQHHGSFMFWWLGVVTIAVLYNLWTCIAREAFREIQDSCPAAWFSLDALSDVIYILDILVQFRTGYLDQGLMVYDSKKLARKYVNSKYLYVDIICLLPLDFFQFLVGIHPMLRFMRFLKVYRSFNFLHMLESRNAYPNLIRVANLSHILFLGAHWFAAFYYLISEAEGFRGGWSYPQPVGEYASVTRKYLASLFWSTLTLTTIGDLPPPESNWEYLFVIVSYLIGVFIFATIVGQVGNVINNKNASRQEFERLLDGAKLYMSTHNVPHDLQKRVQRWYDYVWSRGRLNGADINSLGLLPDKLKTELAIHVNLETLKKVTIFQECQPEFLHDLVLKMKAYIFTPGDLICRRGEVAREMFIVADGLVEIISESGTVLKQMGAGDFFGEIGILNLDGGINRRTADVRSVGYSELFVLSREDVLGALKDHPDAESIIRDYGQRRLREIEAHRNKVKPLQHHQNPIVRNNLLSTLRNMSPKVRRAGPHSPNDGKSNNVFTYPGEDDIKCVQVEAGVLHRVYGGIRRLFHRKVRRQKTGDDSEGRIVWSSVEEGRPKTIRFSSADQCGKKESGNTIANAIHQKLSNKHSGYEAVNTEDHDTDTTSFCPEHDTPSTKLLLKADAKKVIKPNDLLFIRKDILTKRQNMGFRSYSVENAPLETVESGDDYSSGPSSARGSRQSSRSPTASPTSSPSLVRSLTGPSVKPSFNCSKLSNAASPVGLPALSSRESSASPPPPAKSEIFSPIKLCQDSKAMSTFSNSNSFLEKKQEEFYKMQAAEMKQLRNTMESKLDDMKHIYKQGLERIDRLASVQENMVKLLSQTMQEIQRKQSSTSVPSESTPKTITISLEKMDQENPATEDSEAEETTSL
ncbi:cyclic nucleotide-gated olfactory channel isoform X2 [Patella vulgata]|nr:cyclic nucleotide-gated olfactory channel isoform X2 [Patella vulgata]